ncbi:uncharacterized protein LOC127833616 [Dreissena polymorpha]|uniref:Uncharacterized protein n=1 Tax=Dreissena polymorpha TaxID=45954 RepID=A0A9D4G782_DREPO|nr:uncharacterized protein LOC127833616 [Dreissena polymorpha]XP_052214937.1 uncharacterized protein LOC127833616 [Dreissena polymorpha]KAH3811771.1 hypothetical protein DPMN_140186 [Dreissena polymorpha]
MKNEDDFSKPPKGNFVDGFGRGTIVHAGKNEIPPGAILMTDRDVIDYQNTRIQAWEPQSDVWWHSQGKFLTLLASNITGCLITQYFRKKFRLQSYGVIFTFAPTVAFPALASIFLSEHMRRSILTVPECVSCYEIRAGILQTLSSSFYSALVAPWPCVYYARKYHTYLAPENTFKPTVMYGLRPSVKSFNIFLLLVIANFGVGWYVTHKQAEEIDTITEKEVHRAAITVLDSMIYNDHEKEK